MNQALLRDERGSVSVVFIALLLVVTILMIAFLDREWANYTLKMAEDTADFAAEAGAGAHEVLDTVTVSRSHWDWDPGINCDPPDEKGNVTCSGGWVSAPPDPPYQITRMPEDQMLETWRSLAGCGPNTHWASGTGDYQCTVALTARQVVFIDTANDIAANVFNLNWPDKAAAQATAIADYVNFECRTVSLPVEVHMTSLFGAIPWKRTVWQQGKAIVQLPPPPFPYTGASCGGANP
ncbi:MAG TPA: hypothetical protein VGK74_20155 [Symbiobacteriaceae bacterium]|jgi:hypothetical protein